MKTDALIATSHAMLRDGRGLLAMDESTGTCDKRLLAAGIPATAEYRRAWRELLVTAPGLGESIGGAILYDETIRQSTTAGVRFADVLSQAGIIVGIKVDTGAKPLALRDGETVTEGLDGLRDRLADYASLGARFAKWRGVMTIAGQRPSAGCIRANAEALARYAALCQEAAIVPVIEPEVLMEGAHGLRDCAEATEIVLHGVFAALRRQGVCLEGMILKPNMVLAGLGCADQPTDAEVAEATLRCLRRAVPACVPGIAFLSGGQSGELATRRLAAMNAASGGSGRTPPWALSFSFARAIQHPALEVWHGQAANVGAAQRALVHRAAANRAARLGRGKLAAAA